MSHNNAAYVQTAIKSIVGQRCQSWSACVFDDYSVDNTSSVVEKYLQDRRICYDLSTAPLGQATNWRRSLSWSDAPIVGTLHADDYWAPELLGIVAAAFDLDPELDLFIANWAVLVGEQFVDLARNKRESKSLSGREYLKLQLRFNPVLPSVAFLSRHIIDKVGWPNPKYKMIVDVEYFIRVALKARRVRMEGTPLAVYRVQPNSASAQYNRDGTTIREIEQLVQEMPAIFREAGASRSDLLLFYRESAKTIFEAGLNCILNEDATLGRSRMLRAVKLSPSIMLSWKRFIDLVLSRSGEPGRRLMRKLHPARLRTD